MTRTGMFEQYIAAFNAGDATSYGRFYAPDIVFRNGAGATLSGAAAVIAYYDNLKSAMSRVIEVRGVVEGSCALSAALASRFTILADGTPFAGERLSRGDRVSIESIALYEFGGDRFARIVAETLSRRIERLEGSGQ